MNFHLQRFALAKAQFNPRAESKPKHLRKKKRSNRQQNTCKVAASFQVGLDYQEHNKYFFRPKLTIYTIFNYVISFSMGKKRVFKLSTKTCEAIMQ